jgi:Ni/Fe-hydrogenase 1 B-type cytochrome subunit
MAKRFIKSSKIDAEITRDGMVYVYEAPVRAWHWINATAIVGLFLTGYLIGSPPPALTGEPSAHYLFGWIRFIHFACGQIMAVGILFRLYWSFVGNYFSREIIRPPFFSRKFWRGVWLESVSYLKAEHSPRRYIGHNPLAIISMHVMFMWVVIFMIITGFALYGEGEGAGWIHTVFTGPVLLLVGGNSFTIHTLHHFGMWAMVIFVLMHIYAAVREDILSREAIITSMISGWRKNRKVTPID